MTQQRKPLRIWPAEQQSVVQQLKLSEEEMQLFRVGVSMGCKLMRKAVKEACPVSMHSMAWLAAALEREEQRWDGWAGVGLPASGGTNQQAKRSNPSQEFTQNAEHQKSHGRVRRGGWKQNISPEERERRRERMRRMWAEGKAGKRRAAEGGAA